MAFILLDDYQPKVVSPQVGAYLWQIKNGKVVPKQKAWRTYAERVKKVYLNPAEAPAGYAEEHKALLPENGPVRVWHERWLPIETRRDLV